MPLTKVMVATDHSRTARRAEEFVAQLATPGQTLEVILLSVHPELPVTVSRGAVADVYVGEGKLRPEEQSEGEALLREAAENIRKTAAGAALTIVEHLVGSSDVGAAIVREAERLGVEAIVIGTRGHSDLTSLLIGSTSHKVLHLAHCPVILVR